MKTGFLDRVLIYLFSLIAACLAVLAALRAFGLDLVETFFEGLSAAAPGLLWKLIVSGLAAVVVLLAVYAMVVVTPSRKKKSAFVTLNADENGQVRVALPAIRELAMQALRGVAGSQDAEIRVYEDSDAISVAVNMNVTSDMHVPTVTMNLQRAIKEHIQKSCGVSVRNVTVVVDSVLPAPAGASFAPAAPVERPESAPQPAPIEAAEPAVFEETEEASGEEAHENEEA